MCFPVNSDKISIALVAIVQNMFLDLRGYDFQILLANRFT